MRLAQRLLQSPMYDMLSRDGIVSMCGNVVVGVVNNDDDDVPSILFENDDDDDQQRTAVAVVGCRCF